MNNTKQKIAENQSPNKSEISKNLGAVTLDKSSATSVDLSRSSNLDKQVQTGSDKIIKWLKSIVWCNAHDTAWIEETIAQLEKLK